MVLLIKLLEQFEVLYFEKRYLLFQEKSKLLDFTINFRIRSESAFREVVTIKQFLTTNFHRHCTKLVNNGRLGLLLQTPIHYGNQTIISKLI